MNKAVFVAVGILLSRLAGLVRIRVFAHYFGLSPVADAFMAAFRIPNVLQNLFGEGALSGSFIPVYAGLVASSDREQADRVAGAIGGLLAAAVSILVAVGVLATPILITVIAPGYNGETRALTITLVRILFPGAGLLVLSAWCLGILNSHHRFLLSYTAPVLWNAAMIATLVAFGGAVAPPRLAVLLAWGSVAGSLLQLAVQVPSVRRVARARLRWDVTSVHVRTVARNFVPVFLSRGVVQVSAYIDTMLASWLPAGAVAALSNAQLIYTLPVSLFGMSVAAAELPAMSGEAAAASGIDAVRIRLQAALRRVAYLVVPSAVAFLALGDHITGALLQTGRFTASDAQYVWGILAGSAVGLLASTLGRLYSSTCYALRDTRTPLRFAIIRIAITTSLGYVCAFPLPRWLGMPPAWGAAGLTASAGLAGWVEFALLRRAVNERIGWTGLPGALVTSLWGAAFAAALVAWAVSSRLPLETPLARAVLVLTVYGLIYLAATAVLGVAETTTMLGRLRGSRRR
ncbi:MAG: murein biosynthesis integral membrane protein MurJ [Vicinamibacterales bacterium]